MMYLYTAALLTAVAIFAIVQGVATGQPDIPVLIVSIAGASLGVALHIFFKNRNSHSHH